MNRSHLYELMIILSSELTEAQMKLELAEIKKRLGSVTFEDFWGRRKLAYPVKKQDHGFYAVWNFKTDVDKVADLTAFLRLQEAVLRHLVIKVPEDYIPITHEHIDETLDAFYLSKKKKDKNQSREKVSVRGGTVSRPYAKKAGEVAEPVKEVAPETKPELKSETKLEPKKAALKVVAEPKSEPKESPKSGKKDDLDKKLESIFNDDFEV